MLGTTGLHNRLLTWLRQEQSAHDDRHLQTLAWMILALLLSGGIGLTRWSTYLTSRARCAQSHQRRLRRWLSNPRIHPQTLYAPLIRAALRHWGVPTLYLALDTSVLWDEFCLVQLAILFRGRAVPLAWRVMRHKSAAVGLAHYQLLLNQAARRIPPGVKVVLLADRGFVDLALFAHLKQLGWHGRIRLKAGLWIHPPRGAAFRLGSVAVAARHLQVCSSVRVGKVRYGPVHLALAHPERGIERWYVLSDEPVSLQTIWEYGLRFQTEQEFKDNKSGCLKLEECRIREVKALSRLYLVVALSELYGVSQGMAVVESGERTRVDPHWFRGMSYLKIGIEWVKRSLNEWLPLQEEVRLSGAPDPAPAISSRKQYRQRLEQIEFGPIMEFRQVA